MEYAKGIVVPGVGELWDLFGGQVLFSGGQFVDAKGTDLDK